MQAPLRDRNGAPITRLAPVETGIPSRYEIRKAGNSRFLLCDEAPRLRVSIERTHSFSENEARDLGERVILLDGAGRFAPTLDNRAQLYNLDHHNGCLRIFTLSTCEQALLLVHSGLKLATGDWSIYANEPDLDTIFAIWVLLNYARVTSLSPEARDVLLPLIRLEGAIDANGSELSALCGLPQRALLETKERIDRLHRREMAYKVRGEWLRTDLLDYTVGTLREIDALVYTSADFREYTRIEKVYGHVEIGEGKVAVVCRDRSGIYEIERLMKSRWGDQLGLVALEKERNHYTLRRTAPLATFDLHTAYDKLNLLDPAVDGRPPGKRWGGGDDIGGSPRPDGTQLSPAELIEILGMSYRKPGLLGALRCFAAAAGWAALLLFLGLVVGVSAYAFLALPAPWNGVTSGSLQQAAWALTVGVGSWGLSRLLSHGRTWLYGFRRWAGRDWLALAPVALLAALPLRAWVPQDLTLSPLALGGVVLAVLLAALALEACFRGLVHGLLLLDARIQYAGGGWFVSRPAVLSAVLYSLATVVASLPWLLTGERLLSSTQAELALVAGCALVGGIALAMIRERSLSIWPGVLVQGVGLLGCAAALLWYTA